MNELWHSSACFVFLFLCAVDCCIWSDQQEHPVQRFGLKLVAAGFVGFMALWIKSQVDR